MLGAHNPRLERVRSLRTKKGRREHGRFTIEGATLLREALRSGVAVEEVYGTPEALASFGEIDRVAQARVYTVDERAMRRLSDLDTAPGILAVAPIVLRDVSELFSEPGLVLVLAGLSDPGNAGTLLRTAESFGVDRVVFGSGSVEPYAPKVVRGAMGSLFRLRVATADPGTAAPAWAGWSVTGLDAGGEPLEGLAWPPKSVLVVGQERHGLGAWQAVCERLAAIRMASQVESLNAAVAGAIALYEASKNLK